jgi:hypothetical protein
MKTCPKCHVAKALTDFHRNTSAKDGLQHHCKGCITAHRKLPESKAKKAARDAKRYEDFAVKRKIAANNMRNRRTGWTSEEFEKALVAQDGRCDMCNKPFRGTEPCADHEHGTNIKRSLLCFRCNTALGYLETPGWLAKAHAYLAKHGSMKHA